MRRSAHGWPCWVLTRVSHAENLSRPPGVFWLGVVGLTPLRGFQACAGGVRRSGGRPPPETEVGKGPDTGRKGAGSGTNGGRVGVEFR